ncbi:MAG: aminotransferase class III-fold pyridoxal phosphate-dependent enzyme [Kineosporiaceae bacterium]
MTGQDHSFLELLDRGKAEVLDASIRYWNPGRTRAWIDAGVPLVIGEREGYRITDLDGHQLVDLHLNGGTYNLGHRHPEVVGAVRSAMDRFDIGNHHFASVARAALAEALVTTAGPGFSKATFGSCGGEVIDLAIKCARYATGRRVVVSVHLGYHGHTGFSVAAAEPQYRDIFHASRPEEFLRVPFDDLAAMEEAVAGHDVAAVLLETIPATCGFVMPSPGYLAGVKSLCERYGAVYIADEVQTGLMRTGSLWAITKHGVTPDVIVTAKGLSGGVYPMAAVILSEATAGWMDVDGSAHIATFGGAELGCVAALASLDVTLRSSTAANVAALTAQFAAGFAAISADNPGWVAQIRQDGLVCGLKFAHPTGAKTVMRHLYERGVWAIFSGLDPSVLQVKPGLLLDAATAAMVLDVLAEACALAAADLVVAA